MIVTEILIFVIALFVIKYFWDRKRFFYLASKIPSAPFDVSFRRIFSFITSDTKVLWEIIYSVFCADKNELSKLWLGPILFIITNNPDDVKIVFNSKKCYDKPYFMKLSNILLKGLLFGDLEIWKSHRKIMNPFFGYQSLRTVIPIFNEKAKIFIKGLENMVNKGEFNVFHNMAALTLETILKVMDFDVDIQTQEAKIRDNFINSLEDFVKLAVLRMAKFWYHPDIVYNNSSLYRLEIKSMSNSALVFTNDIVDNIRTKISNENIEKPTNFMQALMNPKNNLTDNEIKDEVQTILLTAQDTSAIASSTTILMLAMFKDIQQKVVDELHQIFGKKADAPYIHFENLSELTYLEMVINEVMRLFPVVPFVLRQVDNEIVLSNHYIIPAKATINVPIQRIHRNKKYWGEDAEEFKPERFSKENFAKIHPYAYLPFIKGPRMCLGYRYAMMSMKIQLANFLMHYEVDTNLKFDELEFTAQITMNVCQGYMITIKNRKY